MDTSISEPINSNRDLEPRVRRANQILESIIGSTSEKLTAKWRLKDDASGRLLVDLLLIDSTGASVEGEFKFGELTNDNLLLGKFYKIWGDLLQARSHQQLNQMSGKITDN